MKHHASSSLWDKFNAILTTGIQRGRGIIGAATSSLTEASSVEGGKATAKTRTKMISKIAGMSTEAALNGEIDRDQADEITRMAVDKASAIAGKVADPLDDLTQTAYDTGKGMLDVAAEAMDSKEKQSAIGESIRSWFTDKAVAATSWATGKVNGWLNPDEKSSINAPASTLDKLSFFNAPVSYLNKRMAELEENAAAKEAEGKAPSIFDSIKLLLLGIVKFFVTLIFGDDSKPAYTTVPQSDVPPVPASAMGGAAPAPSMSASSKKSDVDAEKTYQHSM